MPLIQVYGRANVVNSDQNNQNNWQQQTQQRDNIYSTGEDAVVSHSDDKQQAKEVIIERGNTPRVSAQSQSVTFPTKAPSSPPLPEEHLGVEEQPRYAQHTLNMTMEMPSSPASFNLLGQDTQEFLWLFEYGLEMDSSYLNHTERLNGLALAYGVATLKGYRLAFGTIQDTIGLAGSAATTYVTLLPAADAEVWGFLYRIPRRVMQRSGNEPALLDSIHYAQKTQHFYQATEVIVHETLRNREVSCITYILTESAQKHFQALSPLRCEQDKTIQTLGRIATEKKLPAHYIKTWLASPLSSHSLVEDTTMMKTSKAREQNTEPLPVLKEQPHTPMPIKAGEVRRIPLAASSTRRLVFVACYQFFLLLGVLALLVLQDFGLLGAAPTLAFQSLNIPWLILAYGLIGGSISGIVALVRNHQRHQGSVLIVTWLARPYIGSVCALLAYLLLSSGLFAFNLSSNQHGALCLLICIVAGFSEGWLFARVW